MAGAARARGDADDLRASLGEVIDYLAPDKTAYKRYPAS